MLGKPRLRVIQGGTQPARQTCSTCPHINKCWQTSTNNIIINLLVCRIQNGIEVERSTRTLLQMVRPQLQRYATQIRSRVGWDAESNDHLILEMEGVIIEHVLVHYVIGDIAFFTYYLFGFPNGIMRKWVLQRINKEMRYLQHHVITDEPAPPQDEGPTEPTIEEESGVVSVARRVVRDGVTLRASEYRILQFCLRNARPERTTRMVDGLHIFMSSVMKISRTRVTQHYRTAKRRLVEAVGDVG